MTEPCEFCGGAVGQYPHGCPGCSAPQCCQRCCNGGSPSLIEQFRRMRADLDRTAAERDALRAALLDALRSLPAFAHESRDILLRAIDAARGEP